MAEVIDFGNILRDDLTNYSGASNLKFNEKIKSLIASGKEIYHFGFGQSPFPVPAPFVKQLQKTASINDYLSVAGLQELREEIVSFHKQWDNVELGVDNIIVGPGSKELIYLCMTMFKGRILLPAPAWTTYNPQAKLSGHSAIPIQTSEHNKWKLTKDDLMSAVDGQQGPWLLVLTNPGNPSGCVYQKYELEVIAEICRKQKIIVLSDEIYARLAYSGDHVCMSQVFPEGTILTSGFSKWSSAGGWRLGYAHFPSQLSSLYNAVLSGASHTYSCGPANIQHAIARAMRADKKELEQYIIMARNCLMAVAKYCNKKLEEVGVTGHVGEAGYYFMPDFSVIRDNMKQAGIMTGQDMCDDMLSRAGVALMPSSSFLLSPEDLHVRFCYVIFDGGKCMEELKKRGTFDIDQDFLKEYCPDIVKGMDKLCGWVDWWKNYSS